MAHIEYRVNIVAADALSANAARASAAMILTRFCTIANCTTRVIGHNMLTHSDNHFLIMVAHLIWVLTDNK